MCENLNSYMGVRPHYNEQHQISQLLNNFLICFVFKELLQSGRLYLNPKLKLGICANYSLVYFLRSSD